jgi:hypothetical protein
MPFDELFSQREEGTNLYKEFKLDCNKKVWKQYPEKNMLLDVKKSRIKKVQDGMACDKKYPLITDGPMSNATTCKNTYRNVKEYFYIKEYKDVNTAPRNKKHQECLKTSCADYADWYPKLWNPRQVDDTSEKMKYCSGKASKSSYKYYMKKTY